MAQTFDAIIDARRVAHGLKVAIERPAAEHGQAGEVDVVACMQNLLALAGALEAFGADLQEGGELLGLLECLAE